MSAISRHLATLASLLLVAACVPPDTESRQVAISGVSQPPIITGVHPKSPRPGDTIKIRGKGFGKGLDASWISVASKPVNDRPSIVSWSDTEITATLGSRLLGDIGISIVRPGITSDLFPTKVTPTCAHAAPFEVLVPFPSVGSSSSFSVASGSDCNLATVGRFDAGKLAGGFLHITDEAGVAQDGFPILDQTIDEWRSIEASTGSNYFLAGTTQKGGIALALVDAAGQYLPGWPKNHLLDVPTRVYGAVETLRGIAVVGALQNDSKEVAFAALYDRGGAFIKLIEMPSDDGNSRTLGITSTRGGYTIVGDQERTHNFVGNRDDSWLRRISHDGVILEEHVDEQYLPNRYHDVAATANGGVLAVGEQDTSAYANLFSIPFLGYPAASAPGPSTSESFLGVEALRDGSIAVGTDKKDGLLTRLHCAGPGKSETVDMGGDERFEDVTGLFDSDLAEVESGYVAVGSTTNVVGIRRAMMVRRDPISVDAPTVALTLANGVSNVQLGQSSTKVVMNYEVTNAWHYEILKVDGPGPEPSFTGAVLEGAADSGQMTLEFDSKEIDLCLNSACRTTIYKLRAYGAGSKECDTVEIREQVVEVDFQVAPANIPLLSANTIVVETYGAFDSAPNLEPAHLDVTDPTNTVNRCFTGMGVPYKETRNADPISLGISGVFGQPLDESKPQLLSYHADEQGNPTTLAMYGLANAFFFDRPTLRYQTSLAPQQWLGHFGGWHTGDGGMAIVTPSYPLSIANQDWKNPASTPPEDCSPNDAAYCGAQTPWHAHPALWDLHIHLPIDGSLPRIVFTSDQANLVDPCKEIPDTSNHPPLTGCTMGTPTMQLVSPFFNIDGNGEPILNFCD